MQTIYIVNPAAGHGRAGARWRAAYALVSGAEHEVLLTQRPGHGRELARRALESGARLIVAVGGDGDSNAGGKSAPTTTIPNTPKFPPAGEEFVLRPGAPDLRVRLGDRITFAMGDAGDGEWTAASEDPAVIWIERSGSRDGTPNAGGRAVGLGETEVLVQYRGEPPRPSARFAIRVGER